MLQVLLLLLLLRLQLLLLRLQLLLLRLLLRLQLLLLHLQLLLLLLLLLLQHVLLVVTRLLKMELLLARLLKLGLLLTQVIEGILGVHGRGVVEAVLRGVGLRPVRGVHELRRHGLCRQTGAYQDVRLFRLGDRTKGAWWGSQKPGPAQSCGVW